MGNRKVEDLRREESERGEMNRWWVSFWFALELPNLSCSYSLKSKLGAFYSEDDKDKWKVELSFSDSLALFPQKQNQNP